MLYRHSCPSEDGSYAVQGGRAFHISISVFLIDPTTVVYLFVCLSAGLRETTALILYATFESL